MRSFLLLFFFFSHILFYNLCHHSGADSLASFSNGESLFSFKSDRSDQFDGKLYRVAGHNHFHAPYQGHISGNIGRSDVKLRFVAVEKRGVSTLLLLWSEYKLRSQIQSVE